MEHESDNYTNCHQCFWYRHQSIIKGTGGLGGRRISGDHPTYSLIKNCQNSEMSPRDSRRLAVPQTLVKYHQLKLM